ncbi:MAG: peptidoglycan synthetase [Flavobacteriales bacterium]|nr:peptidoglycan synthetase [Flavobacteriales bacterium]
MNIHFIAIGGSAMHNLALALHEKGYTITGSDDAIFEPSKSRLEAKGILPKKLGWYKENITSDLDAVILGMHAKKDNPELIEAQKLGVKIYSYPEFIYEQSKDKTRVIIAGSHGKTSITAMILHTLNYHNKPTDYMVGALIDGFETMVKLTKENDFIVLEGDEYLSSPIDLRPKFLHYKPNIALISGIAWDHINVFPTFSDYTKQFDLLLKDITDGGALIYNSDDKEVVNCVENAENYFKKFAYTIPKHIINDGITYLETEFGEVPLQIFGEHNLLNLEGARLICNQMGVQNEDFYEAISSFKGASKRLEKVITNESFTVFKDFAHAPSKVKATVNAVKNQFKNKTVVSCFELHTYSSLTPEFLKEYSGALDLADEAIVYYSEEALKIKQMNPISEQQIKDSFNNQNIRVFTNKEDLENYLKNKNKNNSVFLMMSSGNYGGIILEDIFLN